ncbi:hypothetical protein [Guptibacillus spartinae]|uniref:hypothetical protein n=1 Tax=Guptibacillus spartinae TaxID=3025679 RepID=UPI0023606407|nr:hypothetical protein [Pseudalkalibacillus spartinae]
MNIRAKIYQEHYYVETPMRIIKETDEHFFAVRDLNYLWLNSIDKLDWLEKIQIDSYDMRVYHYAPINSMDKVLRKDAWILEFPILLEDLPHFNMITLFFDWIIDESTFSDVSQRCEYAVKSIGPLIPKPLIRRMIDFLLGQDFMKRSRVRLMHSQMLAEYII